MTVVTVKVIEVLIVEKYVFQALGLAYVVIGIVFHFPFTQGVSSSGLTLIIAGIVLIGVVEIESRRHTKPLQAQ